MLSAAALSADLAAGRTTSVAVAGKLFAHIAATEPELHAFNTLAEESAMKAAAASDARRAAGKPLSALDGVPVAVKDNIVTQGLRTTCSSRILENFVPPYNATVVQKMQDAGMVILGKTNLDEFAMGSSTENSAFGASRNPWDTKRVPGGSSGGSAAAVAGGQAPLALGTDTGGSIRQPASLCGITGVKPTYGRVSRYGAVAFASSLDQIGPLAQDVASAAHLLRVISGHDPKDSTSADIAVPDYAAELAGASLKGVRVGRPAEFFSGEGMDPQTAARIDAAVDRMAALGAEIVDVSMPHLKYSIACYYIVATAECSSNLARYDGAHYGHRAAGTKNIVEMFSKSRAEGFGPEVKRRIMMGTHALSSGYYDAFYMRALKVRTLIKQDYDRAFEKVDLIAAPTSPFPAFEIGARATDPVAMYLCDIFTLSLNLAGYCGISIPVGFVDGLPVGMQLFGGAFKESDVLKAAYALEQDLGIAGKNVSPYAAKVR